MPEGGDGRRPRAGDSVSTVQNVSESGARGTVGRTPRPLLLASQCSGRGLGDSGGARPLPRADGRVSSSLAALPMRRATWSACQRRGFGGFRRFRAALW